MLCHFSLLAVFARFQSFGTSPPVMNGRPSEVAFVSSDPELQSRLMTGGRRPVGDAAEAAGTGGAGPMQQTVVPAPNKTSGRAGAKKEWAGRHSHKAHSTAPVRVPNPTLVFIGAEVRRL